jgi:hypothetical protein
MPISAELKRVYASAPQDTRYIETLQLSHSLFPRSYWLTNDLQEWDFALETGALQRFQIVPFAAVPPTNDGKGQQDLQIVIDNVGREAMAAIEAAAMRPDENIVVVYRVYVDRTASPPQNDPLVLSLQNIQIKLESITAAATRADVLNRPFPSVVYRTELYPGLDR